MHNALPIRNLSERRREKTERAKARETDRASGIRLDLLINLLLMGRTTAVSK